MKGSKLMTKHAAVVAAIMATGCLTFVPGQSIYATITEGDTSLALGNPIAIGAGSIAAGTDPIAIGSKAVGGNEAVAVGKGVNAIGSDAVAVGTNSNAVNTNGIAVGNTANSTGANAIAVGFGTIASGDNSIAIGYGLPKSNKGKNTEASGTDSVAIGRDTLALAVSATALGNAASVEKGADSGTSVGDGSTVKGLHGTAIGTFSQAAGNNSTALGPISHAMTENSVAVGYFSNADVANSAALGANSTTTAASTTNTTQASAGGYTYTFGTKGATATGVVSVGGQGDLATNYRQVQNVANGEVTENSTDAVNGSQLFAVIKTLSPAADGTYIKKDNSVGDNLTALDKQVAVNTQNIGDLNNSVALLTDVTVIAAQEATKHSTVSAGNGITVTPSANADGSKNYQVALSDSVTSAINKGWNAQIDGTTVNNVTPSNKNMNFVTGDNIVLSNDNGGIKISTSKDISVDTIKVGDTVNISNSGIDAGGTKVTNVAAGDVTASSTDAVNGSQLYATNQQVQQGWNAQIDGTTVNNVTPSNKNMNFVTGDNIVLSNSNSGIKISTSKNISVDTVKVGDTVNISSNGIDAGGTKVTNMAAGDVTSSSTDAVNGSQLYAVEQKIDTTYGDTITKIGNAINQLGDRVDKVGAGAAALAALHPLDFDPDDKWDFAAGYGHYKSEGAAAIGAFYRPNEDTMLSLGASLGNGESMWNTGLSVKLGQGNHVSTSRVAMAKEIVALRDRNQQITDRMNAMEQKMNALMGIMDMSKSKDFPDVPANHWAYEAVAKLAGNGIIKGYPDGTFKGDRSMTRYEFAMMLYSALKNGASVDGKLIQEFQPELERIRVDMLYPNTMKIERVRVNSPKRTK